MFNNFKSYDRMLLLKSEEYKLLIWEGGCVQEIFLK